MAARNRFHRDHDHAPRGIARPHRYVGRGETPRGSDRFGPDRSAKTRPQPVSSDVLEPPALPASRPARHGAEVRPVGNPIAELPAALPEIYRRPLVLAEFERRSVAEIARELGLTPSATKSRLARGRLLLRQKLEACCRFETDRFGKIIDFRQKQEPGCCGGTAPDAAEARVGGAPAKSAPGTSVRIEFAADDDQAAITGLLASAGLPTSDLTPEHFLNFVAARIGRQLVGCAGVEPLGKYGLLRSVAVVPGVRGSGLGRGLVKAVERLARGLG
ncbi:MAG: GNAT family N-acetyltransferase, partial [Verrucomicrobia bacterium]|nr:GNAT family N-acetyltransferase [Verrucomicrobiota bacterium]